MATQTSSQDLNNLTINRVTSPEAFEQMISAGVISANEFYLVEGEVETVDWSKITNPPSTFPPEDHSHGNITNAGAVTATAAIANGDKLAIVDNSNSSKITGSTITFDGSTATKALTQKGTWETFNNYTLPTAADDTLGGIKTNYPASDKSYAIKVDNNGNAYVNVPWTDNNTWKANSSSSEGYVASGNGQANKVWKTDANGNPAWRDDANSGGTVTSVRVQASSPLQSSQSTAQNNTLNTTISFANQDANKVLAGPSSGSTAAPPTFRALVSADIPSSVSLSGAPTAPTATAGTNSNQIATTEFVTRAVSQGFVANDAMVFKGLIGSNQTITQLPTSGYNAGWTYRVADAGTFAGEYCEVGDLLIAINDGPASGSSVIGTDWGKVEHNIDGAVFRGAGASNSSVGSSTQPVYVNGSGIVTAITGAIANDTTGNAATATKATQDESGNNIKASYAASFSISDHTITLKNKNGSSLGTVTVPDNNTTYTFNTTAQTNKIQYKATGASSWTDVPITVSITNNITGSGTSGSLAKFNGTNTITTGPSFSNAISSQDQTTKFLREDGTWSAPTYTTSTVAAQIIRW